MFLRYGFKKASMNDLARAAGWKDAGVSPKDLAQHLYSTSSGVEHSASGRAEYRDRMRVAVRIACTEAVR